MIRRRYSLFPWSTLSVWRAATTSRHLYERCLERSELTGRSVCRAWRQEEQPSVYLCSGQLAFEISAESNKDKTSTFGKNTHHTLTIHPNCGRNRLGIGWLWISIVPEIPSTHP